MMKPVEDVLFRHEVVAAILRVDAHTPAQLEVLLRTRNRAPYAGMRSLPSGPVPRDADMPRALRARMRELAGTDAFAHLEQVATFSAPDRDPAQRTIGTIYLALVNDAPIWNRASAYPDMQWVPVHEANNLAFDHDHALREALSRLRSKLSYTNIAFALAPSEFTMAQLQNIYQVVLEHRVDVTNLTRILTRRQQIAKVSPASPSTTGRPGRPPSLYRFTTHTYEVTDPFATLSPERSSSI